MINCCNSGWKGEARTFLGDTTGLGLAVFTFMIRPSQEKSKERAFFKFSCPRCLYVDTYFIVLPFFQNLPSFILTFHNLINCTFLFNPSRVLPFPKQVPSLTPLAQLPMLFPASLRHPVIRYWTVRWQWPHFWSPWSLSELPSPRLVHLRWEHWQHLSPRGPAGHQLTLKHRCKLSVW